MLKRLFFALFLFAVLSCSDQNLVEWEQQSLTEEALEICGTSSCPEMTVNYLLAKGNSDTAQRINSLVETFIIQTFDMKGEGESKAQDVQEALYGFAMAQQEFKTAFPDASSADNYEGQVDVTLYGSTDEVLSLELRRYLFTGGAHGYGGTEFANFNPADGRSLELTDLVSDMTGFLETAEVIFRQAHGIEEGQSLNDGGFWFDQDRFRLPESVGVSEEGLLFVYNPYDIASYADGTIELFLPIDSIEVYLNSNLL